MKANRLILSALTIGACLVLAMVCGCTDAGTSVQTSSEEEAGTLEMITVTDGLGREVTVPKSPDRVVCSNSGCLRYLTYLQAEDTVVGVDSIEIDETIFDARPYALANPQLRDYPLIGEFRGNDDPEKIVAANPQVIFKTQLISPEEADGPDARAHAYPLLATEQPAVADVDPGSHDALGIFVSEKLLLLVGHVVVPGAETEEESLERAVGIVPQEDRSVRVGLLVPVVLVSEGQVGSRHPRGHRRGKGDLQLAGVPGEHREHRVDREDRLAAVFLLAGAGRGQDTETQRDDAAERQQPARRHVRSLLMNRLLYHVPEKTPDQYAHPSLRTVKEIIARRRDPA